MKKVILYIIALSLPLALAGCLDNFHKDEIENISRTVTVKLIPPEGFENESFEGVTVQFANSTRGVVYNVKADANNTVTVDVEVGIYSINCQKSVTVDGKKSMLMSKTDKVSYGITEDTTIDMDFIQAFHMGELVIKEIYFAGTKDNQGGNYLKDQYAILYNNTDQLIYLDNYGVSMSADVSLLANNVWIPEYLNKGWTPLYTYSFVFPTNADGTLYPLGPGEEAILAFQAIDHTKAASSSVNLARPGCFAMYTSSFTNAAVPDTDAGVVVLELLHNGQNMKNLSMTIHSATLAIFKIEGTTPQEYITREGVITMGPKNNKNMYYLCVETPYIVDAVEFANNDNNSYRFPAEVNNQRAGIYKHTAGSYLGVSYHRKVKEVVDGRVVYEDTNNTQNDFEMLDAPTLREN